jgi:ribonuclease BN (tRNA processing enzyme)
MDVLILGIGDAFTRRSFGSSALIRTAGGECALIDCPDPIHRAIDEASSLAGWGDHGMDASAVTDVILTHIHGDHSNGLESLGFWHRHRRASGAPGAVMPRLHAAPPVAKRVWEKLAPAMDGAGGGHAPGSAARSLEDYFDLRPLDVYAENAIASLRVRCRYTKHPLPTVGLLVSDGQWTLGWSADTPFEQAHIDWLSQADIIVHECNVGPPHTHIDELSALPESLQRKIRLIHLPDDFDPARTDMAILHAGQVLPGP